MSIWKQATLACLCALLVVWWWTQRYSERPDTALADHQPTLTVRQATTYRYDANGALLDTLQADSVHYYHDARDTRFERPVLRREIAGGYLHGKAQTGQHAPDGRVHFNGEAQLARILDGQTDITVRSNTLTYDPAAQTLESSEEVQIDSPESRTLSLGAVWQLERNYLILKENIRSHYEPSRRR